MSAPHRPLRLGFAGTPEFAARLLAGLLESGLAPAVVYTRPDRPRGRGRRVEPSAVKTLALAHHLPLEQPRSLRGPEPAAELAGRDLDVLVVAAYGLLLPPAILAAPRLGCLNVHASLLPRWRGAAPVERAIMAGDTRTGVCIMAMDRGLDTGPVYDCRPTPIDELVDGPTLEVRLAELGSSALLDVLRRLPDARPRPQPDEGITYAAKLTRADAIVDWQRNARQIHDQVRALSGRMPAFTFIKATRVTLLETRAETGANAAPGTLLTADPSGIRVACGAGVLNVQRLRLNVGKGTPLRAADAVNGYRTLFQTDTRLAPAPAGA